MRKRLLTTLLTCFGLAACQASQPDIYEQQLLAFGTLVDISLYGVPADQARPAVQAVDSLFQKQHRDWHAWQRGALDHLNGSIAAGDSQETATSIVELIKLGQQFEVDSGGLFNPAMGSLFRLWGFQQDEPPTQVPDPADIATLLNQAPQMGDIELDGRRVRSSNPAVQLDFGGFAKGISVDQAVSLLKSRGMNNLIVNAGGDLCLSGSAGNRPWRIGIRAPEKGKLLASLELSGDHCVFTSGDYERGFEVDGRRYHHILDPRTGYPATGLRSVTVIATDAALADAAATALFVAGPANWPTVARRMGIKEALVLDAEGTVSITAGLRGRTRFSKPPKRLLEVEL